VALSSLFGQIFEISIFKVVIEGLNKISDDL